MIEKQYNNFMGRHENVKQPKFLHIFVKSVYFIDLNYPGFIHIKLVGVQLRKSHKGMKEPKCGLKSLV